jgi:hypothetical protein
MDLTVTGCEDVRMMEMALGRFQCRASVLAMFETRRSATGELIR